MMERPHRSLVSASTGFDCAIDAAFSGRSGRTRMSRDSRSRLFRAYLKAIMPSARNTTYALRA